VVEAGGSRHGRHGGGKGAAPKPRLALPRSELGDREYLCGSFTLAEAPYAALAMVLEVDGMAIETFPRLIAYLERLRSRPRYRSISPRTPLAESAGNA
jgi:glutathione S-transferase